MSSNDRQPQKFAFMRYGITGAILSMALISPFSAAQSSHVFEMGVHEVKDGYTFFDAKQEADALCTANMPNGSWRATVLNLNVWTGFPPGVGNRQATLASFWYACS